MPDHPGAPEPTAHDREAASALLDVAHPPGGTICADSIEDAIAYALAAERARVESEWRSAEALYLQLCDLKARAEVAEAKLARAFDLTPEEIADLADHVGEEQGIVKDVLEELRDRAEGKHVADCSVCAYIAQRRALASQVPP